MLFRSVGDLQFDPLARHRGVLLSVSIEDKTSAAFAVMAKLTEVKTEVKNSAKNRFLKHKFLKQKLTFFMVF